MDQPGAFQADICFMAENQVFNRNQGIVCLSSTKRNIAWAVSYQSLRDARTGYHRRQIRGEQMYPLLVGCVDEIER